MNIVLIGYRGAGKTTLGRLLAAHLGVPFLDVDPLIVERAGMPIKDIFARLGEPAYREIESAVVAEAARLDRHIIGLGGGTLGRPANATALKANGFFVYLQADVATLHRRIEADPQSASTRPNLTPHGGIEEVRIMLAARDPIYRSVADVVFDIAMLSPADALPKLLPLLPRL